jgi:diguanylate cyclase (GGDEF)-like protein
MILSHSTGYDSSIAALLEDVRRSADLEGAAILDISEPERRYFVLSSAGFGGIDTVATGYGLLVAAPDRPTQTIAADKRAILALPLTLPLSERGGLLLWRGQQGRPWTQADHGLVAAVGVLLQSLLSAEAGQIGIDRQTGLPNRRWFIDEVDRHIDRLDLDDQTGTLFLVDIYQMRRLNADLGRPAADRLLVRLAGQLRAMIRPADLLARVGGDEFAIWQNGMDHLTAAERADALCSRNLFQDLFPDQVVTVSIGIASRLSGSGEDVRLLLQRARGAVRDVKGAGGWRVAHPSAEPPQASPA